MKRITMVFLWAVWLLVYTGCGNLKDTAPMPKREYVALQDQPLSTEKIPQKEGALLFSFAKDALPQDLPPQLLHEDEIAYGLSLAITNVLCYEGNCLEDFYPPQQPDSMGALKTALNHTRPIALHFSYDAENGFVCSDYPNHALARFAQALIAKGKYPTDLYYAEDVRDTAVSLFGQAVDYEDADNSFYEYFPDENVYVQLGDFSRTWWLYPQITSYQKTDEGYICEAVLVSALDKETPMKVDDIALTKENFTQATIHQPTYRYVFVETLEGNWIVAGLQTLSK